MPTPERGSAGLLLDTVAWLWLLGGDRRLRPAVRRRIESRPDDLWLSPVSVWELGVLRRRGRFRSMIPFQEWLEQAFASVPLRDATVTRQIAARTETLPLPTHDPADRFIAATALAYDLTVVTSDRELIAADWLPTLS